MKYPSNSRNSVHVRTYSRKEAVVFRKTKEEFGGLSNMATGFPLEVNGLHILTSEALYQACRFPHMPEIQRIIIGQRSPMTAKMESKPHRRESRADWDQVKVKIMRWCLHVKLAQNWTKFSQLLLRTGNRPIVEESRRDDFWGAKVIDGQTLMGINALGRLLMELREKLKQGDRESLSIVEPLAIPAFLLDGRAIGSVCGHVDKVIEAADSLQDKVRIPVSSLQRNDASLTLRPTGQGLLFDRPNFVAPKLTARRGTTNRLKPYLAYRDSGVPWLGDVPEHWKVVPNRATFKELKDSGHPDEQMLSVTITQGVILQSSLLRDTSKKDSSNEDRSKYKLVCPGDITYNKMRAWQGALGVSQHRGIISPAYIVVRPRGEQHAKYFHYLLRTPAFTKEAEHWSYGISSDQWSLRPEEFRQIYCCVPPLPEQTAIVRYLGYMDRRIRRYISAKKKLIALLNEQKQAIIQRAVTRGLDPNVLLKPSGVEWLWDVPEHWRVIPSRYLFRATTRRDICSDDVKLSVTQRQGLVPTVDMQENSTQAANYDHFQVCYPADLVLNKYKAHLGVFWSATQRGLITPNYTVFRPLKPLTTKYYELLFHTAVYRSVFAITVYGVTEGMSPLYTQDFYRIPVMYPPHTEQQAIVEQVEQLTASQNAVIRQVNCEIALLQEYRTRFISDVVTGKLDVRAAAAGLPEEVGEEPDAFGEAEALNDSEATTEDDEGLPMGAINDN